MGIKTPGREGCRRSFQRRYYYGIRLQKWQGQVQTLEATRIYTLFMNYKRDGKTSCGRPKTL